MQPYGPGLRVRLRIVDRDFDFQVAEIRAPEPLGHFGGFRQGAAVAVQPRPIL